MHATINVIGLGPDRELFQICDGTRYGMIEFASDDPTDREARLRLPHVVAFLQDWLDEVGALTGGPNPPLLEWVHIEMAVVAARA